jgi:hypothetical protein
MSKSLYEIIHDKLELLEQAEQLDGDISELQEAWEYNEAEAKDKVQAYLQVIDSLALANEGIRANIDRLETKVNQNLKVIENLRSNLLMAVDKFGKFKYDEGMMAGRSVFIQQRQKLITDFSLIEDQYKFEKIEVKIYTAKIKEDLKNDVIVKGAYLEESKTLVIK